MVLSKEYDVIQDAIGKRLKEFGFQQSSPAFLNFSGNAAMIASTLDEDKPLMLNFLKRWRDSTKKELLTPEAARMLTDFYAARAAHPCSPQEIAQEERKVRLAFRDTTGTSRSADFNELNNNFMNATQIAGLKARMRHLGMNPNQESHHQI